MACKLKELEFFEYVNKIKNENKNKNNDIYLFLRFVELFQNKIIMGKYFTSKSMEIMNNIYDLFYTRYKRCLEHEKLINTDSAINFYVNQNASSNTQKQIIYKYLGLISQKAINLDLSKDFVFSLDFEKIVKKSLIIYNYK